MNQLMSNYHQLINKKIENTLIYYTKLINYKLIN